jgi:hypothetical protein
MAIARDTVDSELKHQNTLMLGADQAYEGDGKVGYSTVGSDQPKRVSKGHSHSFMN